MLTTRTENLADGVTLYLGDCRDVLPTLPPVDAVVTDPPYGIEGTWSGGNSHGWGKFRGQAEPWDQRPEWFADWLAALDCEKIVWGGNYLPLPPSGAWLVWDKDVRQFSAGHCELAWTNLGAPIRAFTLGRNHFTPAIVRSGEEKEHPTQKPTPLMEWAICFLQAKSILDPFMGSGTTGVAAVKLGRKFIGIEMVPKYFDMAARRISEALKQPDMFIEKPAPRAKPLELPLTTTGRQ